MGAEDSPFTIEVYSKTFQRLGVVRVPDAANFHPKFNGLGVATLELGSGHPATEWLDIEGARIRVLYRGEDLLSGPVRRPRGRIIGGARTYGVESDWRVLSNTEGWVVPDGNLTVANLTDEGQSYNPGTNVAGVAEGSPYYHVVASSAEGVVKEVITANVVNRLHRPVTVRTNLFRGGDARAAGRLPQIRFDPLDEALADILDWSGLGLKVWHDGSTSLQVDVWQPATWSQVLTPESGIVVDGEWSLQYPTATRVVVGGPDEDVSRAFWGVNDATGLEDLYGDVVEVFRDSTGGSLKWGTTADENQAAKYYLQRGEVALADKDALVSQLNEAGRKGLSEGAPTAGISASLSETDGFHFGGTDGVHLGDVVSIRSGGVTFTERITECDLTLDTNSGLVVTPQVGERRDDPEWVLADAIRRLAAAQRRLSSGR